MEVFNAPGFDWIIRSCTYRKRKKVGTTSWKRRKILESCFNQSNLENCFQVILSSKTDVLDILTFIFLLYFANFCVMKIEPVFGSQPWNLFNQKSDVASNLENGLEATLSSKKRISYAFKKFIFEFLQIFKWQQLNWVLWI